MRSYHLALVFSLCTPVFAQQFVVDPNGGPGTFTEISAAVAAVPDGSTLIVHAGIYAPVLVANKGVTILCDPGVTAHSASSNGPFLEIRDTLPNQVVTVFNLHRAVPQFSSQSGGMSITNVAGPVTVDGLGVSYNMPVLQPAVTIQDATQVAIRRITVSSFPAVRVENAHVVFESCALHGRDGTTALFVQPAGPGILAIDSDIQLVDTSASGGDGSQSTFPFLFTPPEAAIVLTASSLRMTGNAVHELRGGNHSFSGPATNSVIGSGAATARIEPTVTIIGPVDTSVAATYPNLLSVRSTPTAPGQPFTVERRGIPGNLSILGLSVRSPTVLGVGPETLWLDTISYVLGDISATPTSGMLTFAFTVPNEPLLRGFQVVWQSVELDATGNLLLSNPSPSFVR